MFPRRKRHSKNLSEILEGDAECLFCRHGVNSKLGPLYEYDESDKSGKSDKSRCVVHYFCLLFSSGLSQCEDDSLGIEGFLIRSILTERNRTRRLKCTYCGKTLASIGCSVSSCPKSFHLPCAMKSDALLIFKDNFNSFCKTHAPKQNIPLDKLEGPKECSICLSDMEKGENYLWSPCCGSWAHKDCLNTYAASAGYFFKCPLCNDARIFCKEMMSFGIYVPEQDASWEKVPHAFEELTERYGNCDGKECLCPKGRSYDVDYSEWEIILCRYCGASGIHAECGGFKLSSSEDSLPKWSCDLCCQIFQKLPTHHFHPVSVKPKNQALFSKVSVASLLKTVSFRVSELGENESMISMELKNKETVSIKKNKEMIPSPVSCMFPPIKREEEPRPGPSTLRAQPVIVPILSKSLVKPAIKSLSHFTTCSSQTKSMELDKTSKDDPELKHLSPQKINFELKISLKSDKAKSEGKNKLTYSKPKTGLKRKLEDQDEVEKCSNREPHKAPKPGSIDSFVQRSSISPSTAPPLKPSRRPCFQTQPPLKRRKVQTSPVFEKVKKIPIIDPKQKIISSFFRKMS